MPADVIMLDERRDARRRHDRPDAPMIRVMVAGEPGLRHAGTRALLERERDVAVVSAPAAADVVVLVAGPDAPLLDALRPIRVAAPRARVLVVADPVGGDPLVAALAAGVRGVVSDGADGSELVRAVRLVAAGRAVLSPCATGRLIAEIAVPPGQPSGVPF